MSTMPRLLLFSGRLAVSGLVAAACATHDIRPSSPSPVSTAAPVTDVVLVGNNWEGTVVAFSPMRPHRVLGTFNLVPDKAFLDAEADDSLSRSVNMHLIRGLAGEGHVQLVDDVLTSPDGRYLYGKRQTNTVLTGRASAA